jgi:hypothetical protein
MSPGVAWISTVLVDEGAFVPCTENRPKSAVATLTRNGALFNVPTLTVMFSEGTPAGISNGTCTLSWVGLMKRMGAARPPIFTEVPSTARGAVGGTYSIVTPLLRCEP